MSYKYASFKKSYEDLSSGRVLYNAPGFSAFPVRLTDEIIQGCFTILSKKNINPPYSIYDPCCGGGYLLTSIGLLHGDKVKEIFASDIDPNVIKLCSKNLKLLSHNGLCERIDELEDLSNKFNKSSHFEALESALKMLKIIRNQSKIAINTSQADAVDSQVNFEADIIIADFPYGKLTHWDSDYNNQEKLFLDNMIKYLKKDKSVLAIITDKKQKLNHPKFKIIEKFNLGKRRINIMMYIDEKH